MKRLIWALVIWTGMGFAAFAQTVEERMIAGLQGQGYVILEQGYTFLGRLRIVAQNDQIRREMVVNPGTGEVLRDYAILLSDLLPQVPFADATRHSGTRPGASASIGAGVTASTAAVADGSAIGSTVVDDMGVTSTAVPEQFIDPDLGDEWVFGQPLPIIQVNP